MSYFAKASLTGVEKVAVAIVLARRRRQLSALQGLQARDALACGAAVRVDATAVSALLQGVQGRDVPSLAGVAIRCSRWTSSPQ